METVLGSHSLCVTFGSCSLTGLSFPSCAMIVLEMGILFWVCLCLSAWGGKRPHAPQEADQLAAQQPTLQNYLISQSGTYYRFKQLLWLLSFSLFVFLIPGCLIWPRPSSWCFHLTISDSFSPHRSSGQSTVMC